MTIQDQLRELKDLQSTVPTIRLWNGNMEFICGVDDDVKTQFDYLCNDTGVGTITLRQGS